MNNLIPQFIEKKYSTNEFKGNFQAATMFMDISGFTTITENLMNKGKEGAEIFSSILNSIFTQVTESVYHHQGFITGFAGDAFTAIFPADNPNLASLAAIDIQNIIKEKGLQKTKFGDFQLFVKIGLSYGNVDWGIIGNDIQKVYYFKGEAIDGCAASEHLSHKGKIILDERLHNKISSNDCVIEPLENSYYILKKTMCKDVHLELKEIVSDKEVVLNFYPKSVLEYNLKGEFRNIVPIFISFKESDGFDDLNDFVSEIIEKNRSYGGFFSSLDFGDKGGNIFIIFGAPISYEGILERALNFFFFKSFL